MYLVINLLLITLAVYTILRLNPIILATFKDTSDTGQWLQEQKEFWDNAEKELSKYDFEEYEY